jgi:hypothetical protein
MVIFNTILKNLDQAHAFVGPSISFYPICLAAPVIADCLGLGIERLPSDFQSQSIELGICSLQSHACPVQDHEPGAHQLGSA